MSTRPNNPGPGRLIDKYIYQPAGRLIEGMVYPGQPSEAADAAESPHVSESTDSHYRPRHKKRNKKTFAREFWFYAANANALSECSLATVSSTSTRTNKTGPGRILDKYVNQVVGKMIERCLGRIALKLGPNANMISERIRETTPFYVEGFAWEFLGWNSHIQSYKMSGCMKLVAYAQSNSVSQQISALKNMIFLAKECTSLTPFLRSDYVLEAIHSISRKRIGDVELRNEKIIELDFWKKQALAYLGSNELSQTIQEAREFVQFYRLEPYPRMHEISCIIRYAIHQTVTYLRNLEILELDFVAARHTKDLFQLTSFFGIQNMCPLDLYGQYRATVIAELLYDVFALIIGLKCGRFRGGLAGLICGVQSEADYVRMNSDWIFSGMDYEFGFAFDQFKFEFDKGYTVRLRRLKAIFDLVALFHKMDLEDIFPVATEDALKIDWKAKAYRVLTPETQPEDIIAWRGYPRNVVDTLWEDCLRRADNFLQVRSLEKFDHFVQERWMGPDQEHRCFFDSLLVHSRSVLEYDDEPLALAELFGETPFMESSAEDVPNICGSGSAELLGSTKLSSRSGGIGRSFRFKKRSKLKGY